MIAEVKITPIRGTTERVKRRIAELQRDIKDMRSANRQVSIWLLRWVNDNFRSEGGKVGGWVPFRHGGRRVRGGVDSSAKLLQHTGRLRSSVQPFYTAKRAGVGSPLHYSGYHDVGARNLPQRRILPDSTDRDVERGVLKIYESYVQRILR